MPIGIGYGVVRKRSRLRKSPNKLCSREIEEKFQAKGKKPKKKDPPKSRSDIRRPTAKDLSDMVRRRTKAGAKTEGIKRKRK